MLIHIYLIELEIKNTTYTARSASYLDLYLETDNEARLRGGRKKWLTFLTRNVSLVCSSIPPAPVYGVCISQLLRYSRACGSCHVFLDRMLLPTRKIVNQEFVVVKLKSLLKQVYSRHHAPCSGQPLRNIYVTNDHGYVPFVVITILPLPHIIFTIRVSTTQRVPLVEQESLTFPGTFFMGGGALIVFFLSVVFIRTCETIK